MASQKFGFMLLESLQLVQGNEAERERVKLNLEKDFRAAEREVDNIVEENHDRLKNSIHSFTKIAAHVSASQERIRSLKESLRECKQLLHCKREDLQKLWIESVENKHILKLLDRIEEVKGVPELLNKFIAGKYYLSATQLLVNKVAVLEGELSGVEALRELRLELQKKKENLPQILIDALHSHLYTKAAPPHRKPVTSRPSTGLPPSQLSFTTVAAPSTPGHKKSHSRSASRSLMMSAEGEFSSGSHGQATLDTLVEDVKEDIMVRDPEEDTVHFMAILVESLAILGSVPEAIEAIKSRMNQEMGNLVEMLSDQVASNAEKRGEPLFAQAAQASSANQAKPLLELLHLCFEKFRAVAQAHSVTMHHFKRANQAFNKTWTLYKEADVWAAIQYALELLLRDYFDLHNIPGSSNKVSAFQDTSDVAMYFDAPTTKRRHFGRGPHVGKQLFSFERSELAINVNTFLRERQQGDEKIVLPASLKIQRSSSVPTYLCKPQASNVTAVFNIMQTYIKEIEATLGLSTGKHCPLYIFLEDFVQSHYIDEVQGSLAGRLEVATKGTDAYRVINDDIQMKKFASVKPLLRGTMGVWECLSRLQQLREQLPPYASQFTLMACKFLGSYNDHCQTLYRRIVRLGDDSAETLTSAQWILDTDILSELKAQPAWQQVHHVHQRRLKKSDEPVAETSTGAARFSEETELFLRELVDEKNTTVTRDNILADRDDLRLLASLQESLEWLSFRVYREFLAPSATDDDTDGDKPPSSMEELYHMMSDFADRILLLLHVEVRLVSFLYLLPVATRTNYKCEDGEVTVESSVQEFNRNLIVTEEIISAALQPHKTKFVFEGLGHMVAKLMRSSTKHIQQINANGIKKLCRTIFSIQQNLTNITMAREYDLDRTRQYFELLHLNADELLKVVFEQGPIFSEVEYESALRLMSRFKTSVTEEVLEKRIGQLHEFLNESI